MSFRFLANNFSPEAVQAVYDSISCATLLPSEMVAAAVYMQSGSTAEQIAALADQGCLMCFHTPGSADENSPLALLTVQEGNKSKTFYTVDFGCFHPEMALLRARNFAREHAVPVINAVSLLWNDKKSCPAKTDDSSHRLFIGSDPEMTQAMTMIFKTCPAVAAHITFWAEENRVQTEYNPLWRELAERLEGMADWLSARASRFAGKGAPKDGKSRRTGSPPLLILPGFRLFLCGVS